MTNENEVKQLTDMVASFVDHISKKLPDDVVAKLEELGSKETAPLPACKDNNRQHRQVKKKA